MKGTKEKPAILEESTGSRLVCDGERHRAVGRDGSYSVNVGICNCPELDKDVSAGVQS